MSVCCPMNIDVDCTACPRVMSIVRHILTRVKGNVSSDLADDCRVEAMFEAWRIQNHLPYVSNEKRCAYCMKSVARAIWRYVNREIDHNKRMSSYVDEINGDYVAIKPHNYNTSDIWSENKHKDLLQQVGDERIIAALRSLGNRAYTILNLYYSDNKSDGEIACLLGISEMAAARARRRAIEEMRRYIKDGKSSVLSY